ncbi:type VI secretion system-associated FHA domain protein TagH [Xenophilus sp. Marseille-Q4582]|uniref:type VI secretion system-associated FHA domain protein TagH n=1 Tax=Xenophilus sp. Marseille-Q4582 TaxID=2866600 RepID=UPI001CE3E5DD|nr:type VI secretion system-associated FHA domain protein TagH [Xenophilus sp. Marseille-Q4582]
MIEIVVVAQQGATIGQARGVRFGPEGGTLGRADTNTLVLSDPDRTVSRVHAQVLYRDGRYFIVDRGSNPLYCNGVALGAGNEVPLTGGERLVVGGFELAVSVPEADASPQAARVTVPAATVPAQAGGADDPFADLLQGLAPAAPVVAAARANAPASAPAAFMEAGDALAAPLSGPGRAAGSSTALDPFADLLGPPSSGASSRPPDGAADDFSDLGLPAAARPTANAQRIDELFGGMGPGLGGDPLALSPLADPLLQPNTAARDDPLAAFGEAPTAVQAARSDHLPIGQFGFVPPKVSTVPPPAAGPEAMEPIVGFDDQTGQPIRIARAPRAAQPATAPLPEAPHALAPGEGVPGAADAFDDLLGALSPAPAAALDGLLEDVPSAAAAIAAQPIPAAPAPAPAVPSQPLPATHRVAPPQPQQQAPVPVPVPAVAAPAVPVARQDPAGDAELLAAFLRGLGPVHQAPTVLTPALMERIGSLLRSATEGTLQLLLTRQELKREVRAEVTLIAAQANNPLKFSPTADVALAHLLGPGIRGFMPAEAAMRDAYDDLRAHQFGVMVGMRAALERLIARFEPQELEKKIAARSALDSLFAANRKAKLWDQFHALYQTIASEAEDDFHALFGKAFREAYEAQMARLKGGGPPAS